MYKVEVKVDHIRFLDFVLFCLLLVMLESDIVDFMKGIIALDIDGTLTTSDHQVAPEVVEYLELLQSQDWVFIFISGRPYAWALDSLKAFTFPYFFAVYNGAYILSMPEGKILEQYLLNRSVLQELTEIAEEFSTGFVVYGSLENREPIFFTPSAFDQKTLDFFDIRARVTQEDWIPIESIAEIPHEKFTSIKFFVPVEQAEELADAIEQRVNLHVPIINDRVDPSYCVLQATSPKANKGDALENFSNICGWSGVRIAAGDDLNDFPMFQKAQITIAMQNSPLLLRQLATVIAPAVEDLGLINGLKMAIAKHERKG